MNRLEHLRRDWLCYQWACAQSELEQAVAQGNEARSADLRRHVSFCEREAARSGHTIVATTRGPRFKKGNLT